MDKRIFFVIALIIIICLTTSESSIGQTVIKLGTMAPKGSIWDDTFIRISAELMRESQGQLELSIHPGRDESRLIGLLRSGSYDAVSLAGAGLGDILPEAFIFQLPMLFSTYDELTYVRDKLTTLFEQEFEEEGYVLLGWGDIGLIYLFSTTPIATQADLQQTRFWVWDIDRVVESFAAISGARIVSLPIQDVLPSLQNGDVQTVYNSPLACIAFKWHTEVKYMSDLPLAVGVGATLIKKRQYNKLTPENRELLRKVMWKHHQKLVEEIQRQNTEAIEELRNGGIEVIRVPPKENEKWSQIAVQVQNQFAREPGKLYSEELLDKIRELLDECRQTQIPGR